MQALVAVLEEAAGEAGVRLKRLEKKSEKAALLSEQQALEKQLQAAEDPAAELSLAVPLIVQRVRHQPASVHFHVWVMIGLYEEVAQPPL